MSNSAAARCPRALAALVGAALAVAGVGMVPGPRIASAAAPAPSGRIAAPVVAFSEEPAGAVDAPPVETADPSAPGRASSGPVEAPGTAGAFRAPGNTDFVLDFDGSVDAGTRQVMAAAAGVWSSVLDVREPIVVDVAMEPMATGLLGAAAPVSAWYGLPSFPRSDSLYPIALANQLAGEDLEPGDPDVTMTLATTVEWDRSVDGTLSGAGQPMLSVAVHELGHGLGHTSWIRDVDGQWSATFRRDGLTLATPYDRLVADSAGRSIATLDPSALAAAIVSPLRWEGPRGRAANGGVHPRLYSPAAFELGSSVGHLDEATFRSAVMTPFLGRAEVHTSVPAVTSAMLADMGWPLQGSTTGGTGTGGTGTGGTDSGAPTTAAARATSFVRAVAVDFLRREATSNEVSRWRDHLLGGGTRSEVTRAFAWSDEWIGVLVDGLYRSTLGRAADPGGRAFWVGVLRSGQTPAQVAAQFYASDEYFRLAGSSPTAWISDLYAEVLGRQPDPGGLAYWVSRAASTPRAVIALDFYQSLESRRDRVEALFRTLLGRTPDAGGWSYWAGVLSSGRDLDLATHLAASDEYFVRAATRFG